MPQPTGDGGSFPQDRFRNPETAMGGADSVQKTTYVTGEGTEPAGRHPEDRRKGRDARTGSRGVIWAVLGLLFLAGAGVYLAGLAR
jgi:hypothetical protein